MSTHALRLVVIAIISFLTLVDLFATQAILPSLAAAYGAPPAVIGSAVNACTFGMAAAGVAVAYFNRRIARRAGIVVCLALLALPTALLALMPSLPAFAALRLVQGLFMSAAFSLTIAYLAENCSAREAAGALAAYVTGNVASNLIGRLMSAAVVDHFGLASNFLFFAALNLAGAAIAYWALARTVPMAGDGAAGRSPWASLFRRPEMVASFAIGFLILFAFIGTFTYVNFVLADALGLTRMQIGYVYFVFLPSLLLTPLAGKVATRYGSRATVITALAAAAAGLPLLVIDTLVPVLIGLAIVAAGTFFAQATATGYVGRMGGAERGAAGGVYLASYYAGGLAGSVVLGLSFDSLGWPATVALIGAALVTACALASRLGEMASVPLLRGVQSP
jgi:predicted MFS family arabinose efflux permease